MAKTILEIMDGKITKGKKLRRDDYKKYKPLFEALKSYITLIKIEGHEVIIIDPIPPAVLLALTPENQALYAELVGGRVGGASAVVHLPSCSIIITN